MSVGRAHPERADVVIRGLYLVVVGRGRRQTRIRARGRGRHHGDRLVTRAAGVLCVRPCGRRAPQDQIPAVLRQGRRGAPGQRQARRRRTRGATGTGRVQGNGLCLPGPASLGRRVGKSCCGTRSENESADEQHDRTSEATDAAIVGPCVPGPRVSSTSAKLRPCGRRESTGSPLWIGGAVDVTSPTHDDCPERVRVTVKVTP